MTSAVELVVKVNRDWKSVKLEAARQENIVDSPDSVGAVDIDYIVGKNCLVAAVVGGSPVNDLQHARNPGDYFDQRLDDWVVGSNYYS